jgi:parallel beta-helix repeat protein
MSAAYPSSVAGNNTLIVADNRKSTTLLGSISSGTTTIVVSSGVFSDYSVVTIENERILLGTETVSGTYTGCTRGYDSSTAAAHSNAVAVNANVVAAHHNVLREEIQAVETALGANLRFVQHVLNANGFTFSFSGVTTLTGTTPTTVAISPIPLGITTFSPNRHYLYITDGASSEAVLITSVSVGASSTTIGFTPANSHTAGQWTIGSATAGIQEAVQYAVTLGGGSVVQIPNGVNTLRQRIYLGDIAVSVTLAGERLGSSIVQTVDAPIFYCRGANQYWALRNFSATYSPAATVSYGIDVANVAVGNPFIENVGISGGAYAGVIDSSTGLTIRNSSFSGGVSGGLRIVSCNASSIIDNNFNFNTAGIGLTVATSCSSLNVRGNLAFSNTYGFRIDGDPANIIFKENIALSNSTANYIDASTTRTSCIVRDNIPADTTTGAITAAASVALPSGMPTTITVTGTTTIDTITGFWGTGDERVLFCPSGLTFSAAGNIKVALTTTYANQPVRIRYNATDSKWYAS